MNVFGTRKSFQLCVMLRAGSAAVAVRAVRARLPFRGRESRSPLKSVRKPKHLPNAGRKNCLKSSHQDVLLHEPPYLAESSGLFDEDKTGGCLANER